MRPSRVDDLFVDQDERYPDIRQQPGSAPGELDETGNAWGRGDERAKKGKKTPWRRLEPLSDAQHDINPRARGDTRYLHHSRGLTPSFLVGGGRRR
jgi:hypothetical protein